MATWWKRSSSTPPPADTSNPPAPTLQHATDSAGVRTRAQIEALIEHHTGTASNRIVEDFRAGISAALRWALGDTPTGPATGRVAAGRQPNAAELEAEDDAADEMIHGGGRQTKSYYVGAQHALYWVRGECEDTP